MNGNKDDLDDQFGTEDELLDEALYDESLSDGFDDVDGEYGDEDWDAYDGDESDGAAAPDDEDAQKKKRARFNAMVIGGGLLLGVGFLGFNMMKSGPSAPPAAPVAQDRSSQIAAEEHSRNRLTSASLQANAPTAQRNVIYGHGREDANNAPADDEMAGGLLNNPDEVAQVEQYRSDLEQELLSAEDIEDDRLFREEQVTQAAAQQAALEARRAQEPVAAVTVDAEPPMPVPVVNATEPSVLTPLPESLDEEVPPSVGLPRAQDLALAPAATMDENTVPRSPFSDDAVITAEEEMTTALQAAPDMPFGASPAEEPHESLDVVPAAEFAAVTQQLEELQAELKSVQAELAQVQDLQNTVKQLERALEARAIAAPAREPRSESARAPAREAATTGAPRPAPARAQAAAQAAAQTPAVRWELKSARPGQAMVARAGESEMRNVTIGDNLSGVGRITQIYRGAGGWIVEGTSGRITQ